MRIIDIKAWQILDSRGNPTIQVEVGLDDGSWGVFGVPSGASTGSHEALELRDNDPSIYHGKSVLKAIENVYYIKENVLMKDFSQEELDKFMVELDGTDNKSRLGANAILGVSVAFAKASAKYFNKRLFDYLYRLANNKSMGGFSRSPERIHLFANVINGGLHAGNDLNVQEFMLVPNTENTISDIRAISEIYMVLKDIISKKYGKAQTAVGDEGGFAPMLSTPEEALDLLTEAIDSAGYSGKVAIALDAAASDFYNGEKYEIIRNELIDYRALAKYYNKLIESYSIISIEDPFAEDDFSAFRYYMKSHSKPGNSFLRDDLLVVGDDLLVTNPDRIRIAQKKGLCNSLLLKINQIGTLTEALEAWRLARDKGWNIIVSHRSGETTDNFISDLAVALRASIKLGAPARGERIAKYNRLIEIFS